MPRLEERGARLELLDDHAGGREHGEAAVLEPARNRPGESRNEFVLIELRRASRDTQPQHTNEPRQTRHTRQTNDHNKQTTRDHAIDATHTYNRVVVFDAVRDSLVCISLSASGSSGLRPSGSKSRSPGV